MSYRSLWVALMAVALFAPATGFADTLSAHQFAVMAEQTVPVRPSPAVVSAAAPILDELHRVRLEQSRLPPPRTDAERLRRMGALDAAPRTGIAKIRWTALAPNDAKIVSAILDVGLDDVDSSNQRQLLAMVPLEGWFGERRYGLEASEAAFHIVQHADLATQQRFLPVLQRFVERGDARPFEFAKMFDRVAIRQGRPQRYGTQFQCENHHWVVAPLEAPEQVDTRRVAIHMSETFAQTTARLTASDC